MRHFAVILVSALMMAAATYGHPAGGYSADSDTHLTGLDQVDWNSINNGGFAYISTTTVPKTEQPTTKVTNSKSPQSVDANAKLSSGNGIAATPSLLYYDSNKYNTPKDNTPLTKEEQDEYNWLVANLKPETPKPATTGSAGEKKSDSMMLNEEEQNQYDWLKANVKPATTEDMKSLPQPSTNKATWRPIFGNRVNTGADATPTTAGGAYTTSSNDNYNYPSLQTDLTPATKVQPTSYPRPAPSSSYGGRQQPPSSPSVTTLSQKPISKFSSPAVASPSYDDLYSADTGADSTYPTYSANTPTSTAVSSSSRYSPSTAGSSYPLSVNTKPSPSLQPSGGRYTGAQTAGTYNIGAATSPSKYSSQKTFTPYTDNDADTLVLTKDNIDNLFPEQKFR